MNQVDLYNDVVSNYEVILWNKDNEMLPKKYVDTFREAKSYSNRTFASQKVVKSRRIPYNQFIGDFIYI